MSRGRQAGKVRIAAALYPLASNPRRLLSGVDWGTITFFIALFATTAGVWRSGIVEPLFQLLSPDPGDRPAAVLGVVLASILVSQLISNVPFVGLYVHHLRDPGFTGSDVPVWLPLASASTVAGNLTPLGAASNIIVLEVLESRYGITATLGEFTKVGSIVTAANVLVYLPSLYLLA